MPVSRKALLRAFREHDATFPILPDFWEREGTIQGGWVKAYVGASEIALSYVCPSPKPKGKGKPPSICYVNVDVSSVPDVLADLEDILPNLKNGECGIVEGKFWEGKLRLLCMTGGQPVEKLVEELLEVLDVPITVPLPEVLKREPIPGAEDVQVYPEEGEEFKYNWEGWWEDLGDVEGELEE